MTTAASSALPSVRSVLLFLGFIAISSFVYIEYHTSWEAGLLGAQTHSSSQPPFFHSTDQQQDETAINASFPRRRLQSLKPQYADEETLHKQMKSYLGGLYPKVDKDLLPLYLRDMDILGHDYLSGMAKADLIFFWHIPKASGSTLKNIMNYCFDLKRAEQTQKEPSMDFPKNNILNMDTCSPDGLSHSFANQLVNSGMVDVIVSNYFLSGAALFTDQHSGKTFTILRHPVEVALSLFHYRRKAHWERSFREDWMKISFKEYVEAPTYMDNWMTRQLTGTTPWVTLTEEHLERARLVMKRKIFVGVVTEMDETLRQLKAHFGWEDKVPHCTHKFLHDEVTNKNSHPGVTGGRGGPTWNVLVAKDKWDISLYHYGLELFSAQRERYLPVAEAR